MLVKAGLGISLLCSVLPLLAISSWFEMSRRLVEDVRR